MGALGFSFSEFACVIYSPGLKYSITFISMKLWLFYVFNLFSFPVNEEKCITAINNIIGYGLLQFLPSL